MTDELRGMGNALYEQIIDLWVRPEVERRELAIDVSSIDQALIVMHPQTGLEVLLGDEARVIADVAVTRPMNEGDPVADEDIESIRALRPDALDEDAGWVLFTRIGPQLYVAFDFRRNRGQAMQLLAMAREYLATALDAAARSAFGPAIANSFGAAELAVMAQMTLFTASRRSHGGRQHWIAQWARLGNAPASHSSTLGRLAQLRPAARYGERPLEISEVEVFELIESTAEMISAAELAASG